MDEVKATKTIYKIFGGAGLFVAILGVLLSSVTFIGMFAFAPGILGVVFCLISIFHLKKYEEYKSSSFLLQKAGTVTGVIAILLSSIQFYHYGPMYILGSQVNSLVQKEIKETIKKEAIKTIKNKINPSSVDTPVQEPGTNAIESAITEEAPTTPETTSTPEDYFFISVDRLRIRSTPDLNGETLGYLDYGTMVVDLKEESDHKDQITIGGKKRNEPWRKMKFKANYHVEPIIGWIYGGGLVSPSSELIEVNENKYLKTINNGLGKDLSNLIGIEMSDNWKFNGIITYKNSITDGFIKEGRFYLVYIGEPGSAETSYYQHKEEYKGTFYNNQLHGLFELHGGGFEHSDITKIKFEHGKCVWFSMKRNAEGDIYTNEESDPQDCSFDYILDGLQPQ